MCVYIYIYIYIHIYISPCVKLAAMIIKYSQTFNIGFTKAKRLKNILVKAKVTPLEKIKAAADYVKVLGVKYTNMLL